MGYSEIPEHRNTPQPPAPQESRRVNESKIPEPLKARPVGKTELDPLLLNNIINLLKGKTVAESFYILDEVGKWIKSNARV